LTVGVSGPYRKLSDGTGEGHIRIAIIDFKSGIVTHFVRKRFAEVFIETWGHFTRSVFKVFDVESTYIRGY
jgi:hypothetical protein